jgi:hypothetical protein
MGCQRGFGSKTQTHSLCAERMIIEICSSNGKIYYNKKNWIDLIQQHNQVLLNLNRTMILLLLSMLGYNYKER